MSTITRRACLKRIASIAAGATLSSWGNCSYAQSQEYRPSLAQMNVIAEIMGGFMGKYNVPALSIAVARHGQMVLQIAFGEAQSSEVVTTAHIFRIASITKPITSVAIFLLIQQGRLKLNDRIFGQEGLLQFDYGNNYPDQVLKITLDHLLTHTCGGWDNSANDPMFSDADLTVGQLIRQTVQNVPLSNEPGTHFAYSNFGYCLLGRVIEKVTGERYPQYIQKEIFLPCGITDIRLAGSHPNERANHEVSYYGQKEDPYAFNLRRMDSHGGWIATPTDLVQFVLRVDGFGFVPNILDKSTIQTMTTANPVAKNYARGWCVNSVPNWWHGGSLPGSTTILVRTNSGLCWAAFTNTRIVGMDGAIDSLMWSIAAAVPEWRA